MPKKIITKTTLPTVLRVLDRWEGKLTWPLYCERVAKVLGVDSVSKHTMYLYPSIKEGFQRRQKEIRNGTAAIPKNLTLKVAAKRISELEAQVSRLEATNTLLLDQFRRWQYNAYANNVRMELLAWDKPLPEVDRSGTREFKMSKKKAAKKLSK